MTKQERIEHAKAHYADIKVRLAEQTKQSIKETLMYGPGMLPIQSEQQCYLSSFTLVNTDSVSCLFDVPDNGKICVLNYASYKYPGGQFLDGSAAQEEALCHESNLFPILLAFDDIYYDWNRKHLNRAIYLDRALYTPNVVFEHNGEVRTADVLTCASPNYRTGHKYQNITHVENDAALEKRLEFMGRILENHGVKTFITGAWGCGVFMQSPEVVCHASRKTLGCHNIDNIYFAIPDENSSNYKAFQQELMGGKRV